MHFLHKKKVKKRKKKKKTSLPQTEPQNLPSSPTHLSCSLPSLRQPRALHQSHRLGEQELVCPGAVRPTLHQLQAPNLGGREGTTLPVAPELFPGRGGQALGPMVPGCSERLRNRTVCRGLGQRVLECQMRWRPGEDRVLVPPTPARAPVQPQSGSARPLRGLPSPLPMPLELPLGQGGTTAGEELGLWESGRRGLASQCWLHWAGSPGPPGMRRGWA